MSTVSLNFSNQIPTIKLYQVRSVNCSADYSDITCLGYTAYDTTQKVIIISFRGSHGPHQNQQLADGMASGGLEYYFGNTGKVFKVVYDSFILLWNGGMHQDLRQLKYKYPDFELWVNGHSLGGMLSWVASSYLVISGLYKPENIKVVAFGAPRLGDYDFANWYTSTFPYSFHIIHRFDLIPRVPKIDPHTNTTVLFHPRTQVWYNNYMKVDDEYQICEEADGGYCSDTVTDGLTMTDHGYYFNVNMPAWGRDGCPKNISDYGQL
uniref:Lipase_3 domain-containing protein n=1 Tax=Caenorhabditis tropicalis TaxID=1561998 RepID=A0A1I7TEH6_9PELO